MRVLTINIYRNRAESFQTFDYITQQGNFSWLEAQFGRVFGAATMWCPRPPMLPHWPPLPLNTHTHALSVAIYIPPRTCTFKSYSCCYECC